MKKLFIAILVLLLLGIAAYFVMQSPRYKESKIKYMDDFAVSTHIYIDDTEISDFIHNETDNISEEEIKNLINYNSESENIISYKEYVNTLNAIDTIIISVYKKINDKRYVVYTISTQADLYTNIEHGCFYPLLEELKSILKKYDKLNKNFSEDKSVSDYPVNKGNSDLSDIIQSPEYKESKIKDMDVFVVETEFFWDEMQGHNVDYHYNGHVFEKSICSIINKNVDSDNIIKLKEYYDSLRNKNTFVISVYKQLDGGVIYTAYTKSYSCILKEGDYNDNHKLENETLEKGIKDLISVLKKYDKLNDVYKNNYNANFNFVVNCYDNGVKDNEWSEEYTTEWKEALNFIYNVNKKSDNEIVIDIYTGKDSDDVKLEYFVYKIQNKYKKPVCIEESENEKITDDVDKAILNILKGVIPLCK